MGMVRAVGEDVEIFFKDGKSGADLAEAERVFQEFLRRNPVSSKRDALIAQTIVNAGVYWTHGNLTKAMETLYNAKVSPDRVSMVNSHLGAGYQMFLEGVLKIREGKKRARSLERAAVLNTFDDIVTSVRDGETHYPNARKDAICLLQSDVAEKHLQDWQVDYLEATLNRYSRAELKSFGKMDLGDFVRGMFVTPCVDYARDMASHAVAGVEAVRELAEDVNDKYRLSGRLGNAYRMARDLSHSFRSVKPETRSGYGAEPAQSLEDEDSWYQ